MNNEEKEIDSTPINDEKQVNEELFITTIDNPFNPKTQFDAWRSYDISLGYNTLERLSKTIDYLQSELRTDDKVLLSNKAMLDMIRLDPLKVYTLIKAPVDQEDVVHLTDEEKEIMNQVRFLKTKNEEKSKLFS